MEKLNTLLIYSDFFLILLFTFLIIKTRVIMNAILCSIAVFFLIGLLFFALNAPFNGAVQIAIYSIALSIIFAIAIMLTNYKNEKIEDKTKIKPRNIIILLASIIIILSFVFFWLNNDFSILKYFTSKHVILPSETTKQLSIELLKNHLIPFELLGIYLLTALIGVGILFTFKGGK